MRGHRPGLAVAAALALAACATAPKPAAGPPAGKARQPTPAAADREVAPRPADADADVAYYRERAVALAAEILIEIARTDFARMRRGRLYLPEETGGAAPGSLEMALTQAFQKTDNQGILDVTSKILPGDQADIRAHMLRAVALRRLGREKEANFHRELAIGLIESIVHTGDGRGFDSAWTVFRVKEEYEVLKAGVDKPIIDDTEDLTQIANAAASQVTIQKLLPLKTLDPGQYTIRLKVTDKIRNKVLTQSAQFTVI
jgi:hypothetical protein